MKLQINDKIVLKSFIRYDEWLAGKNTLGNIFFEPCSNTAATAFV